MKTLIDNAHVPTVRTRWRTLAVFAHTFSCSSRIVGRSLLRRATPEAVDAVIDRWCGHVFRVSQTSLAAEGFVGLPAPCVLISNHTSLLDIPSVCASFPGRLRFVAKAELRRVPMFGRAMAASGVVFVDRNDRARAIEQLKGASRVLALQSSLWIAAEGGRSRDGTLGPLKKGPLHVAISLGLPIVPVWIDGADRVISAGSLWSTTGREVQVRYGQPISVEGSSPAEIDRLLPIVRRAIEDLRP